MGTSPNDEADSRGELMHGQVCYLQIPAVNVAESARFYESIFGWTVDSEHAGFESPGLIGQWFEAPPAAPDAGLLLWISVDRIDDALERVPRHGGQVVSQPFADGPRWLATIRDPGGNLIGLAQHGPRQGG